MYRFEFKGGSRKPSEHQLEKFFLFFVIGGQEYPLYNLTRDGRVNRVDVGPPVAGTIMPSSVPTQERDGLAKYSTSHNICKLFSSIQGFGMRKTFYSFFMRLFDENEPADTVTIYPFSLNDRINEKYMFRGKVSFLSNNEALGLFDKDSQSRKFVERQGMLPKATLKQIIHVDKSHRKKGVRAVRLGNKQKKQ